MKRSCRLESKLISPVIIIYNIVRTFSYTYRLTMEMKF